MNTRTAQKRSELLDLMAEYRNYGARDSEGFEALARIEGAAKAGARFPLGNRNPFQLYESAPGWQQASARLSYAAEGYWKALLAEKLGITIQTDQTMAEHEQLLNALEVILTAKNTRDCLALHDSRALEQAVKAVEVNLSDGDIARWHELINQQPTTASARP